MLAGENLFHKDKKNLFVQEMILLIFCHSLEQHANIKLFSFDQKFIVFLYFQVSSEIEYA
jgi:hypothetical protein